MTTKIPLAIGTLALVAACTSPRVPLKPEARAEFDTVDSVLIVPPSKLSGNVTPPAPTTPTDPILDALQGYDLRGALRAAWNAESSRSTEVRFGPKLRVEGVSPADPARPAQLRTLFDNARGSAVLFASIDYSLRDRVLEVSAQVEIYPRAPALLRFRYAPEGSEPLDEGSVLYRQRFVERQAAVTLDTARGKLDDAVQGVIRQIITNLNDAP